jgi:beta-1,4-mannooligosaccharide/beta-1,4-mannosyl-N-acetylglucosamine phosphorylase
VRRTPQPLDSLERSVGPPGIPWEDRPSESAATLWRSSLNPIIARDHLPHSNSIFNSAIVPFGDGFAGVFRVDDTSRTMNIHAGSSPDGIDWEIDEQPIAFVPADARVVEIQEVFQHAYDPRVTWLEDRYYVTWCNGYNGPTIGVAYTHDFATFHQLDNAYLPFNRNGVLFPRRIGDRYVMLSRPSDNGHTPFGDIFCSESPDLIHWGRHRHVMGTRPWSWESTKIGAGPTPIETDEGWLVIYHGVLTSCNGFVYSIGAALLDLEEPWRVIVRSARRSADRSPDRLLRGRGHGRVHGARVPLRTSGVRALLIRTKPLDVAGARR